MSEAYLGEIRIFAGNYAPTGWLACDGQMLAVSTNQALFALLGTTYGGDGVNTFGLPNLQGRFAVGQGQGTGLTNRIVGQSFGQAAVTLTEANYPAHTHTITADAAVQTTGCNATGHLWGQSMPNGTGGVGAYVDGATNPALVSMASQGLSSSGGGNQAHNNVQPYTVFTMIIATEGIYPQHA